MRYHHLGRETNVRYQVVFKMLFIVFLKGWAHVDGSKTLTSPFGEESQTRAYLYSAQPEQFTIYSIYFQNHWILSLNYSYNTTVLYILLIYWNVRSFGTRIPEIVVPLLLGE